MKFCAKIGVVITLAALSQAALAGWLPSRQWCRDNPDSEWCAGFSK
jgi:hypothetical protein